MAFLEENHDRIDIGSGTPLSEVMRAEGWHSFSEYCSSMKETDVSEETWGGAVQLAAAAEKFQIPILVHQQLDAMPVTTYFKPKARQFTRTLHLLYDGWHYDAVAGSSMLRERASERVLRWHYDAVAGSSMLRERASERVLPQPQQPQPQPQQSATVLSL